MRIYARNTKPAKVAIDDAAAFVAENHRDKMPKKVVGMQAFGLYADNMLVAVAIMGNPRTREKQIKYSAELVRLAFKNDVRVVGGASKLLKFVMNEGNFYDFFTYQDASGEATNLYTYAGMTFVNQSKQKEYLVKDGYTLQTANRKQKFGVAYVVQYGPDRILGTHLGQDTGKTNKELFLESGFHVETTPGDKVFEWFNPKYKHYLYRITDIEDSGKYYIGVHSILDGEVDEYMGSGGTKFANWREELQRRHPGEQVFKKTIVAYYETRADAFKAEKKAIGTAYKDDPNCKNSTSGGRGSAKRQNNGRKAIIGETDLASQHPALAKEFDQERNQPLMPKDIHVGTPLKVWWTCANGHHWQAEVRKRVAGYGCPACAGQVAIKGKNDLQTDFPEIASQLIPGQIDPSTVSAHSHKKLMWQCQASTKHVFEASVDARTRGRGCPYCASRKVLPGDNDFATVHPELVSWWSDKNDKKPSEVLPNSNAKVWWTCPKGHDFQMSPATKQVNGCPVCANRQVLVGYNDFASQHPDLASEWSDQNDFGPETIISGNTKRVWWTCPNGHEWQTSTKNRVKNGTSCPKCKKS